MIYEQPYYVLFAGINGAGKSTLFQSGQWEYADELKHIARVNADEILLEQGGDPQNERDQLLAGREAVQRIRKYLYAFTSFNQETTLAGRTILNTIERARERGYVIMLHYIGLERVEIAQKRIAARAALGGHNIDSLLVEQRWSRSLEHLNRAISLCDIVSIYDNTDSFKLLARYWQGEVEKRYSTPFGISWYRAVEGLS